MNPLAQFIQRQGAVILDGGLATELEARGADLADPLWSARVLLEDPDLIGHVHRDYLQAGADVIISATYQTSFSGLAARGMGHQAAAEVMRSAVRLARDVRDGYWLEGRHQVNRLRPLVAASIGPYGAALADGSEYVGDYDVGRSALVDFHAPRWDVLAKSGADLLACETIPSALEAEVLAERLAASDGAWAWFSFSCRDDEHISDGTPLVEVASLLTETRGVAAIGVNCTAPRHVAGLVDRLRTATYLPIVAYPNSGEVYRAGEKRWTGAADAGDFGSAASRWHEGGAGIIGGCCRTTPDHVRAIRRALLGERGAPGNLDFSPER
jgi:homocysteine S-methyltransferase